MRQSSKTSLLVVLLAAAWLGSVFHPLLSPRVALVNRDIALFHLPLRASLRALAQLGPPTWNTWLHGGQPVLSNPNYTAFYPPTWLCLAVSPSYSLNLLVLLHAVLAFAGAYRLASRLGCERSGALLAASAFSGGGALLSLLNVFTEFQGLAWLPWIFDQALGLIAETPSKDGEPSAWRRTWRRSFYLGLAVALQVLGAEPVVSVLTGLGLVVLALGALRHRPRAFLAFVLAGAFALLLSAAQLLPTLARLADTPRAAGVDPAEAMTWSLPAPRLAEVVLPRIFGDPSSIEKGLFFGWTLNDQSFPFVTSLYSGTLLALLGLAALLRWPIPYRGSWAAMIALSLFLALGRFNPLYPAIRARLPVLSSIRYPEKFVLLGLFVLLLAGALGWSWLLAERAAGRRKSADFAFALSLLLLGCTLGLALLLTVWPQLGAWYAQTHGAPGVTPAALHRATVYLLRQSWLAAGVALVFSGFLALVRFSSVSRRTLQALALGLTLADVWYYQHRILNTVPARVYEEPPAAVRALSPPRDRIFVQRAARGEPDLFRPDGVTESAVTRAKMARFEPYSGLLWGFAYQFHPDYDLMLTDWGRRAFAAANQNYPHPDLRLRFLGAWNVGHLLVRKPGATFSRELEHDPEAAPVVSVPNPYLLERFRFVPIVAFHQTYEQALAVARAQGYAFDRREHCVRPGEPPAVVGYSVPPRLLSIEDRASRVWVRYSAVKGACLVMATTYDRGWKGEVDGRPVRIYPTAAGQMAMILPEGEGHRLALRYTDPRVPLGLGLSLATLLGGFAGIAFQRRARRAPGRAVLAS